MRKRLMLLAAPLCVVAIAASVAVASPSDAEHTGAAKADDPHAVRPIAASNSVLDPAALAESEVANLQAFLQAAGQAQLKDFFDAMAAATPAASTGSQGSASVSTGGGDFLSCVRNRESGGDYGVYNSGGSGAAGAYQFLPGTWNSTAGSVGRSDLVGVDPAQASPADQDAMAQALYAQQGAAPWGGGC